MSLVKTTYHHVSRGTGKILGIESLLRRKSEIDGAFDRFQLAGIEANHCRGNSLPSTVISAMKTKKAKVYGRRCTVFSVSAKNNPLKQCLELQGESIHHQSAHFAIIDHQGVSTGQKGFRRMVSLVA